MSPFLKSFKDSAAMFNWQTYRTEGTAARLAYEKDYKYTNGFIRLEWSGTTGPATVAVTRLRDGAVVFTATTDSSSALFTDPEIGRNYSWTVTEGASSATGHFYVERNAPRIVYRKQDPSKAGSQGKNLRDMGGWTGANGKVVRQGLIFRSGQLEDCNASNDAGEDLEIDHLKYNLGIRFDLDFRTKAFMETWYTRPPEVEQSARWSWTHARPVIADEDTTPGIEVADGKVRIHLSNVKDALYYTILSATSPDSGTWTPCGAAEQGQDDFEFNASGTTRFYKASVRDEAE